MTNNDELYSGLDELNASLDELARVMRDDGLLLATRVEHADIGELTWEGRGRRGEWGFYVRRGMDEAVPLRDASALIRLQLAPLIPLLVQQVRRQRALLDSELPKAITAIKGLTDSIRTSREGGR